MKLFRLHMVEEYCTLYSTVLQYGGSKSDYHFYPDPSQTFFFPDQGLKTPNMSSVQKSIAKKITL